MFEQVRAVPPLVRGKFQIFIDGFSGGYWDKAKVPLGKLKTVEVQPAGTSAPVKFPSGMMTFDDLELGGWRGTDGGLHASIVLWMRQCADARTGRALLPPQLAKRDVTVMQYDTDGRPVHEWLCVGCFITDPGPVDLESGDEKKVEAALKLSVDRTDPIL